MTFEHVIFKREIVNSNFQHTEVLRFKSKSGSFTKGAMRTFRQFAIEQGATKFVRDTTVAGHHYNTPDNLITFELT